MLELESVFLDVRALVKGLEKFIKLQQAIKKICLVLDNLPFPFFSFVLSGVFFIIFKDKTGLLLSCWKDEISLRAPLITGDC